MSDLKQRLDDLKIDRDEEPRGGTTWRIGVIAIALVALAVLPLWWLNRPRAAEVRVAKARSVEAGAASQTVLNAAGYVTARRRATVSSKVTGKVVEVLIEEGDTVVEGQVLARLDASNIRAGLNLAEAQLRAAETQVEETRVRLAEARLELERARRLQASGIASQQRLEMAQAEVDALGARVESQVEAVAVARRAVDVERQALDDLVIRAPFDGVVVVKNAQPGEMISPISAGGGFTRTGIGTVVDMDSLEIEVDVNEAYINRVEPRQEVEAILDAYPDWRIPARVIAIVPTADRQRATVRVRIGFAIERDDRILPDMGVKVAFRGDEVSQPRQAGVAVPRAAVRSRDGREVVFVLTDGQVERRAVTVAPGEGEEALVVGGLAAGERVVVEGPAELADGDRVKEIEP